MVSRLIVLVLAAVVAIAGSAIFLGTASANCEYGYHPEGNACVPNPPPSCPTGYEFVDGFCKPPPDPKCPPDYHFITSLGRCIPNVVVDPTCQPGYYREGVQCVWGTPTDIFGLKKVYAQQAGGGREWFMNSNSPTSDGIFFTGQTSGTRAAITKNADGSWRVSGGNFPESYRYQVRMVAITPVGQEQWKNIEWTAYVKPVKTLGKQDWMPNELYNAFILYARGGIHGSGNGCEGSAMKGALELSGRTWFKKEIWHDGGYTEATNVKQSIPALLTSDGTGHYSGGNKWIGIKVMIYNINNNQNVKMEIWLDKQANNNWEKVNEYTDAGSWNGDRANFFDAQCKDSSGALKQRNHVINYAGPWASIRTDNIEWDFKWMSVREIAVPGEPVSQNPIQTLPYLFEWIPSLSEYHGDAD